MRPLVTRSSRRDRNCFTSMVEASSEGWPRSSTEKSSESSWEFLRERSAAALKVKWRRQRPGEVERCEELAGGEGSKELWKSVEKTERPYPRRLYWKATVRIR